MKKILMLGGALAQIPSILKAKEMGLYVITCDYLPNNPGHKYADAYYNVSTTDKEGVLALAQRIGIDGIVCYASDPAAPTAAFVAEQLGLPTSPYKSVNILSNKDLFRDFLRKNGFKTPKAISCSSLEDAVIKGKSLKYPIIVKPVDSSGSKGITKLEENTDLVDCVTKAFNFSRCKRIIMEEFVDSVGAPLAGDGFSVNGKLVFWSFADDYFDLKSKNPLAPVAELYPYSQPKDVQIKIISEIQRLLTLLNMKNSAYNFEARIDKEGDVVLMEVGPRNGGNGIPIITKYATGVDMIEYTIKSALGMDCTELAFKDIKGYWATYMVHSNKEGHLVKIDIDKDFEKRNLVDFVTNYAPGDYIPIFDGANGSLGTMITKYDSPEEMRYKITHFEDFVKVIVE